MEPIIILQGITVDQLMSKIDAAIELKIKNSLQQSLTTKTVRNWTREEVAKYLHVSLPTLHVWTKMGWLKSYKIGSRVLYRSDEIDESLIGKKFKH